MIFSVTNTFSIESNILIKIEIFYNRIKSVMARTVKTCTTIITDSIHIFTTIIISFLHGDGPLIVDSDDTVIIATDDIIT